MTGAGFPHSDIFGSKRACRSPKLFAACCVLRRLMTPRHPSMAVTGLIANAQYSRRLSYPLTTSYPKLSKNENDFDLTAAICCPTNGIKWWAQMDLNHRPRAYQARALTN